MNSLTDSGAYTRAVHGGSGSATAGGAGDNTASNGTWVARNGAKSAKVVITYDTTLAATKTLSGALKIQDASASDGAGSADYRPNGNMTSTVLQTGAGTFAGVIEFNIDLTEARSHVRSVFTPDLSATGTDTASWKVTWIFGGLPEVPVPA